MKGTALARGVGHGLGQGLGGFECGRYLGLARFHLQTLFAFQVCNVKRPVQRRVYVKI